LKAGAPLICQGIKYPSKIGPTVAKHSRVLWANKIGGEAELLTLEN